MFLYLFRLSAFFFVFSYLIYVAWLVSNLFTNTSCIKFFISLFSLKRILKMMQLKKNISIAVKNSVKK